MGNHDEWVGKNEGRKGTEDALLIHDSYALRLPV